MALLSAELPFVVGGEGQPDSQDFTATATKYPGAYAQWQPTLGHGPFQGPYGQAWLSAQGALKDMMVARLKTAVKARFPSYAPPDALEQLGLERQIDRGINETDASYAIRVKQAWDTWGYAGTAFGMLSALRAVGYANVVIAQVLSRYYTLDTNGALVVTTLPAGSWLIDSTRTFWSKFQVIFPPPLPASWVSGGIPAESSDEVQRIKQIVNKWRPAHATNAGYIITSGGTWGYPATDVWGVGAWGADTVVTWSA